MAPLASLRIAFGLMMLVSTVRFIALGWIDDHYISPRLTFKYYGFHWVQALPGWGMYAVHGVMLVAALGILIGAWYRLSAVAFFLTFTYCELIDLTYYLNHYYFVSLVAFLLCLSPAGQALSVDAWRASRWKPFKANPIPQAAFYHLGIFRLQAGILYVCAGLAKFNAEWLFDGLPLRIWLPAAGSLPLIGPLFTLSGTPYLFAWGGLLYDCLIPFLLMNRRTAWPAFGLVVVFHIVVGILFQIGVFPLVMIAVAPVFFPSEWHVRFWRNLIGAKGNSLSPSAGGEKGGWGLGRSKVMGSRILLAFLALYFAFQMIFPWRYLAYPGNMFWTEEGYRFGWRVMLMEKSGSATFYVKDRCTGREGLVDNAEFLKPHQEKQMAMQPDMALQYAHYLHEHYEKLGLCDPAVRVEDYVTLNGRPSRLLIDPAVDLSRIEDGWGHKSWVLPLEEN